jgi:GT2 family glycosyltransferase
MPDFELSVTICSWNTREDLRACLRSLELVRDEASFEVLVVENASQDGSGDMVERCFPWVRLMRQTSNLGFTGGHNLALANRRGRHGMLLNSDTMVHPGALAALLAFLRRHPQAGIVGPKLLNPDGSLQYSCRRFPNPVAALFRNTFVGRLFPNNRFTRDYLMQDWPHDQEREVDWVSGAALLLRREALDQTGPLDDTLFMYCEDVDICKRAWNAGWKVCYVPQAVITHAIGRSTDQIVDRSIVRFHRSMFRYYLKHDVRNASPLLRPFMVLFAAAALSLRATLFLSKNRLDALVRKFRR